MGGDMVAKITLLAVEPCDKAPVEFAIVSFSENENPM